jgi:chorismate mutase
MEAKQGSNAAMTMSNNEPQSELNAKIDKAIRELARTLVAENTVSPESLTKVTEWLLQEVADIVYEAQWDRYFECVDELAAKLVVSKVVEGAEQTYDLEQWAEKEAERQIPKPKWTGKDDD